MVGRRGAGLGGVFLVIRAVGKVYFTSKEKFLDLLGVDQLDQFLGERVETA
jgi:hypothetical protein